VNNTTEKKDLKSMTFEELEQFMKESMKEPAFRSGQVFSWLYQGVYSFDQMTNISKVLRERLGQTAYINQLTIMRKQVSKDGTVKYLFGLLDGKSIESVVMHYQHGSTICISTQVGCRMGCKFCASTIQGKERDLAPSEMLDQIILAQQDLGISISNVVLMGMGEPLDNYENVVRFLKIVNDKRGLNIGMRHISLSTCGLCDKIEKLAKEKWGITLSVSLHAPTDEIRNELMPINKKYPVDQLISSCKSYIAQTGRRISFEYTMVQGLNDSLECADQLASLLKGMLCHVNLIGVNHVGESKYVCSSPNTIARFRKRLEERGINATIRRKLGADIDASCGQLRKNTI
jgi:23S rRNA (adenine2503-C2)-methyltransferase